VLVRNFGRNVEIRPVAHERPGHLSELRALLETQKGQKTPIRCRGALHSWSHIIDTQGLLVDTRTLDWVEFRPGATPRVKVGGGCTLRRLLDELRKHGMTLPTLGANDRQTIAGAVASGTHGSGKPSLSHFVESVTLLSFENGEVQTHIIAADKERSPQSSERLRAARCALGALGIVIELELRVIRRYRIVQSVRKFQSLDRAVAGWNDKRWPLQQFALFPYSWTYVVYRRRVSAKNGLCVRLCAWKARLKRALIEDRIFHWLLVAALFLGRWRNGLVRDFIKGAPRWITETRHVDESDRMLVMRHDHVRYVEMELFIPESRIRQAVAQLKRLVEIAAGLDSGDLAFAAELGVDQAHLHRLRGSYTLHYPLFFRRVDQDDTLVSMASAAEPLVGYEPEEWVSVSFVTYRCNDVAYERFSGLVADCMTRLHGARLHWGKFYPSGLKEIRSSYPCWEHFESVRRELDPDGRFAPRLPPDARVAAAASTRSTG
jgi:FAD/FMN-containing dehydrogenase